MIEARMGRGSTGTRAAARCSFAKWTPGLRHLARLSRRVPVRGSCG